MEVLFNFRFLYKLVYLVRLRSRSTISNFLWFKLGTVKVGLITSSSSVPKNRCLPITTHHVCTSDLVTDTNLPFEKKSKKVKKVKNRAVLMTLAASQEKKRKRSRSPKTDSKRI